MNVSCVPSHSHLYSARINAFNDVSALRGYTLRPPERSSKAFFTLGLPASVLDYCVSDGNNLKVEPTLLGNLHTAVRNVSSEEECSFEQLDALIANNQNLSCFLRRTLEQPFPQSYNPNNLKRKTLPVLSRKYIIDSGGSVFA